MKSLISVLSILFVASTAFASEVQFAPRTPYTTEQKALLTKTLQKVCPKLFDIDHQANFQEVSTIVEKSKVDQNMFDTVYTTVFEYETNEAGRFSGFVTLAGNKPYNENVIHSFEMVADTEGACNPR